MKIKETFLNFRKKPSYLLGIDVRQNFVRLVELSYHQSSYQIEATTHATLNGRETSDEAIITIIESLVRQSSAKTKNAAVALPHSVVVCKEVKVDASLSPQETFDFLKFNLTEYVGESSSNISFDYYPLPQETNTETDAVAYKLIAVRCGCVEKWVKLLQTVALKPKIIDVDMYALARAVRRQLKTVTGLVAIINIDYGNIMIVVLDNKKIVHQHEDHIEDANLKSKAQIIAHLDAKLRIISPLLSQPLSKIVLGGEQATLAGLAAELHTQVNIPTIIANPFEDMAFSPTLVTPKSILQTAPMMLISCGLALRVAHD